MNNECDRHREFEASCVVCQLMKARDERGRYKTALELCIAQAGTSDAADGCRLIIETARAALNPPAKGEK